MVKLVYFCSLSSCSPIRGSVNVQEEGVYTRGKEKVGAMEKHLAAMAGLHALFKMENICEQLKPLRKARKSDEKAGEKDLHKSGKRKKQRKGQERETEQIWARRRKCSSLAALLFTSPHPLCCQEASQKSNCHKERGKPRGKGLSLINMDLKHTLPLIVKPNKPPQHRFVFLSQPKRCVIGHEHASKAVK